MDKILVIAGPTAVGKTEYTLELAKRLNGEIVSCDSMQLYKYMDIGSAKPSASELKICKHYLVDEIDPREKFSVAKYQKLALEYIENILDKGKCPIVSGGTGLYLNSILYDMDFSKSDGDAALRKSLYEYADVNGNQALHDKLKRLDSKTADAIHPNNVKKVIRAIERIQNGTGVTDFKNCNKLNDKYKFKLICLTRSREELYNRINDRVDVLIKIGLVKEVEFLMSIGLKEQDISMKGIGYKEIIGYLNDEYDLDYAVNLIKKNTRHYAKRQLTWFRRYNRMKWFNLSEYEKKDFVIDDIIKFYNDDITISDVK